MRAAGGHRGRRPAAGVLRATLRIRGSHASRESTSRASTTQAVLALLAPTDPGEPDRSDPRPRALEEGTTPNGVFAAKLMWTHLLDLAERLGRARATPTLLTALPDPHYVHVMPRRQGRPGRLAVARRADPRVARRRRSGGAATPSTTAARSTTWPRSWTAQDEAWRAWFADHGIEPLTIRYEDARRGHAPASRRRVLDHVGVGPAAIPEPPDAAPGRRPLRPLGRALPPEGAVAA